MENHLPYEERWFSQEESSSLLAICVSCKGIRIEVTRVKGEGSGYETSRASSSLLAVAAKETKQVERSEGS